MPGDLLIDEADAVESRPRTADIIRMATILLVDDHAPIRTLLRIALEGEGHEVFEAVNGRHGLAVYGERLPELVVTDITMPEMNGLEMMLELARHYANVKVIAISGEPDNLAFAKQLGASATLQKPLVLEKLFELVRYHLAH
jgi:two-component system response regulator (stage 0 sporulation protein F)